MKAAARPASALRRPIPAISWRSNSTREIDGRLEFLNKRIEEVKVVVPEDPGDGKAWFGAWVRLADAEGEEIVYQIVGPDEFDVESGRISMDSPVGRALLGRREGDEVVVSRPKGDAVFEVLEVRYAP